VAGGELAQLVEEEDSAAWESSQLSHEVWTMSHMPTAALYCRLSRRTDTNTPNLDQQEQLLRARAAELGYEVTAVFRDHGESAFDGHERPEYVRLVDLIRRGDTDHVLAVDADRLWRDNVDQALFLRDAAAAGLTSIVTAHATIDPANPTDELTATIMAAVGRYESNIKRHRVLRKHAQLAEAGKVSGGGTRPYGYTDDRRHIVSEEAAVIRDLVAATIDGASPRALAAQLNADHVPSVTGSPWRGPTVRRLVTSWRIAGIRSHHDQPTAAAVWPAIVDQVDVERARAALRFRATPAPGNRRRLLTGLLVCSCCDARLVSRPKQGQPSYVIAQDPALGISTHRRIQAEPLEELVVDWVLVAVDDGTLVARRHDATQPARLAASIDADRKLLADLGERLARGAMSIEAFTAAERVVRRRIEDLDAELRRASVLRPVEVDGLRARWLELGHDQRREVLAALVERIEIGPAVRGRNQFDATRVTVTLRA
jgi:site-specific DNA recombinase